MKLNQIRNMPTCTDELTGVSERIHESVLRSYNILQKVEEMLIFDVPTTMILEIIEDLRSGNSSTRDGEIAENIS